MAAGPRESELDVPGDPFVVRHRQGGILDEWIELEAHPPVIPSRGLPDPQEFLLGAGDQTVRQRPGHPTVVDPRRHERGDPVVESAGLHEVGDDHRIARGAGGAGGVRLPDEAGIDRIEPQTRAGGDERGESGSHANTPWGERDWCERGGWEDGGDRSSFVAF